MHIERTTKRTQERELDTADITLSVSHMFPGGEGKKKKGKPLRVVIPYGTETNIQLSLGKSYLSLKIKASDSKQL